MARSAIIRRRRDCFFRLENKSVQRLHVSRIHGCKIKDTVVLWRDLVNQ